MLLAVEGMNWIDADPQAIDAGLAELRGAGFRIAAPTHRFDTQFASSSEGCLQKDGLKPGGSPKMAESICTDLLRPVWQVCPWHDRR
ncbi:MAG: hypothetical protein AAFY02_08825 [Pseudomonadota bacterium]